MRERPFAYPPLVGAAVELPLGHSALVALPVKQRRRHNVVATTFVHLYLDGRKPFGPVERGAHEEFSEGCVGHRVSSGLGNRHILADRQRRANPESLWDIAPSARPALEGNSRGEASGRGPCPAMFRRPGSPCCACGPHYT